MRQASFRITELDCAHEAAQLREGLAERPGVAELSFDVVAGRMDVRFDPAVVSVADLLQRIGELGMTGSAWQGDGRGEEQEVQAQRAASRRRQARVAASAGCLLTGYVIDAISGGSWLQALAAEVGGRPAAAAIMLYIAAIVLGLWDVAPKAWRSLFTMRLDMNLLVCLAASGAMLLNAWLEAAAVSMLFGLSILLEQRSVARARRAIASLLRLAPSRAAIRQADGQWLETDAAEILVGDIVLTRPGERLPVDGVVVRGESTMDESPVTGEFAAVSKQAGDLVFAGALNQEGPLEIRASRLAADSTVARIAELVKTTQASKAPWEGWVERFAHRYTPAVFAAAIVTALGPPFLLGLSFRPWFYNALVLLVIACPCALVISTPVSFVSALATAARRGVLLKGGQQLEACAEIRAIALDKTGTLTTGRPEVEHFQPRGQVPPEQALALAFSLAAASRHPLSQAVARYLRGKVQAEPLEKLHEHPGRGVAAVWRGKTIWLGGAAMARSQLADARELEADAAGSHVWVGLGPEVMGGFTVSDALRPHALDALRRMRRAGVRSVQLLTGDHLEAARPVAERLEIDQVRASALPADKLRAIQEMRREFGRVMMVGDGVNDAPALAAADVGVAMGAAGTDQAIETADVALMSDDLSQLAWLLTHSQRTVRIVMQNIVLALGLKIVVFVLSLVGWGTLWMAVGADIGATLLVIANALRLLQTGRPDEHNDQRF